jgi:hypothetical protein
MAWQLIVLRASRFADAAHQKINRTVMAAMLRLDLKLNKQCLK